MTTTQTAAASTIRETKVLPPIANKRMSATFRRINEPDGPTRHECWGAETADGVWVFDRIEDVGTPWELHHRPTGLYVRSYFGSLKACRVAIAAGWATQNIEAQVVSLLLTGDIGR